MRILITSHLLGIVLLFTGCNGKEEPYYDQNVVKTIRVRTFSAKQNFDKLDLGARSYTFRNRSDEVGLLDWANLYYDKYDNLLCKEDVSLDKDSAEFITQRKVLEYYSPKENKLKSIKTTGFSIENKSLPPGFAEEQFHRDSKGFLTELLKLDYDGKMYEKQMMKYNEYNQRVQVDVYSENGLTETTIMIYHTPTDKLCSRFVTEKWGGLHRTEKTVKRSADLISEVRIKIIEEGEVKSDLITTYAQYVQGIPTIEIEEGFPMPIKTSYEDGSDAGDVVYKPRRVTKTRSVNGYGDISEETSLTEKLDSNGKVIPYQTTGDWMIDAISDGRATITSSFIYNEKGDWIRNEFSDNGYGYIILREILYTD